ncbi:PilN family type IVB pilus formation outer membrane protein [Collimonas sp. PA-H2]|uniref:PilN family type IVB pilus formation outer membrane protein n=1 Tax=Collimonas sp. PA-H2 TaxID=1881062 RepID=UPI000BF85B80|nr:PilN family type IVB pilus formation outer membrane protein [Collimonas sp. PA-H2]
MRIKLCVTTAAILLLAGCTGLQEHIVDRGIESGERAGRLAKEVGHSEALASERSNVVHEAGIWLGSKTVKLERSTLPPLFYEPAVFDRTVSSLSEVAERITLRSGLPTKVLPEALQVASGKAHANRPQAMGGANGDAGAPAFPSSAMPVIGGTANTDAQAAVHISFSGGSFKSLLDAIAARYGVYWKYVDGTIQFFYTETRSFQIRAIPGESALTASVNSGSVTGDGGGSAGGGSAASNGGSASSSNTQNTAVKSLLSVYPSIEKSVAAMLSTHGKVVSSPATGIITVVDTPDAMARIADFIESENKSLSQQVMLNVTVLSVTSSEIDNYGIDWKLVYGDLFKKYGITNTFSAGSDIGSTSFSAGILSTATSKFAGSSLMINALSSQGKVRRQTTASVVTLNNQPVPVQVATQTSYLKQSEITLTPNVGSTASLTPGTVTAGFNMTILPHVLSNGTVMLQFSVDISTLRQLRKVASGNNTIETPEVDTRNFLQRVSMKSNETLVISGFEQNEDDLNRQGVGKANNYLFGGGFRAQGNKEVIVILVTPVATDGA